MRGQHPPLVNPGQDSGLQAWGWGESYSGLLSFSAFALIPSITGGNKPLTKHWTNPRNYTVSRLGKDRAQRENYCL